MKKTKSVISIWLIPAQKDIRRLRLVMDSLSKAYDTPNFLPHITVYSAAIPQSHADLVRKAAKESVTNLTPCTVTVTGIGISEAYFQAVTLRLTLNSCLKKIYDALHKKLSSYGSYSFNPHLSLMYGELNEKTRTKIAKKLHQMVGEQITIGGIGIIIHKDFKLSRHNVSDWKFEPIRTTVEQYTLTPEYQMLSDKARSAVDVAWSAGKAVLAAKKDVTQVKEGISNVVTKRDEKSEEVAMRMIKERYPNDAILSEESAPDLTDYMKRPSVWLIDPLDGSKNASDGLAEVWVSVAYMQKGRIVASAVYNPFLNQLGFGERGKGAYYHGPSVLGGQEIVTKRLKVSQKAKLENSSMETSMSYDKTATRNNRLIILSLALLGVGIRDRQIGSSVGQIFRVARGQSDFHTNRGLFPWDYGPTLLVEEAGGINRRVNGDVFSIDCPDNVCGNERIVDAYVKFLKRIKGNPELKKKLIEAVDDFNPEIQKRE